MPDTAKPSTRPNVCFQPNLLSGIDVIAQLAQGTLGPIGHTVAVEANSRTSTPEILDDAGTLARRVVQIGDPVADAGAMLLRHALWRMRELHGDGAATTAAMTHAMAHEAFRAIAAGAHPAVLRGALEHALTAVLAALHTQRLRIPGGAPGRKLLGAVARAMCPDLELREALTQAVDIVGQDGGITIVPHEARDIDTEFVEGALWNVGWHAPGFSSEPGKNRVRLSDASIVVMQGALNSAEAAFEGLKRLHAAGLTRVMLICDKLGDPAREFMLQAQHRGLTALLPVKAPFSDGEAMFALEDIAVLTGATVLHTGAAEADGAFAAIDAVQTGFARRVWADDKRFGIVGGNRDVHALRSTIARVVKQRDMATDTADIAKHRDRLGRLNGGVALMRVGAVTAAGGVARRDQATRLAQSLQAALRGGVVAGGGAALARLVSAVPTGAALEARWAARILTRGLRAPLSVIATNAGFDAPLALDAVAHAKADQVFDVRSGVCADMRSAGIVDPLEILSGAISVAVSTTVMAMTTDALVLRRSPPHSTQP
jgi:chaperonin GroEL